MNQNSRAFVENLQLNLPSTRRSVGEKRLLRSPSVSLPQKQPNQITFPVVADLTVSNVVKLQPNIFLIGRNFTPILPKPTTFTKTAREWNPSDVGVQPLQSKGKDFRRFSMERRFNIYSII